MKSGWSFRRKYFVGDRHAQRPIAERWNAFAFRRDPNMAPSLSITSPRSSINWEFPVGRLEKAARELLSTNSIVPDRRVHRHGDQAKGVTLWSSRFSPEGRMGPPMGGSKLPAGNPV